MRYQIHRFKTVTSTNDTAARLAEEGAPEGTVVIAEYQTHGRGRGRRRWLSPRGKNLLFSILLRPPLRASEAPWLTRIASRAVSDSLKALYRLPAEVKKPNDIVVRGKKISGVLVESSSKNDEVEYAIVGIGVNVWAYPCRKGINATSINEEIKRISSKSRVFVMIIRLFSLFYEELVKKLH